MIESRPIHFRTFAVSERQPICKSGLEPPTGERVTVLVENVTCSYCLSVISRLLANRRNRDARDKLLLNNNIKRK